jgi:DNA-binding GntR family transcriptional regulator
MNEMKGALSTYRTKGYLVYEALRQAILAGRYQPGARVNIDQLAAELGTSKVPIREAIGRLVGEGWLQMSPHVGAVVPELSPQDIIETSIIRSVTEGAAVRFSASHLTDATLRKLRKLFDRMEEAAKIDAPEYPQLNMEFHAATFADCPFPALKALAASLLEKSGRLRTVRFLPEYLPEAQAQHRKLLHALEKRDGKSAERITRHHVERAGQLLARFALSRTKPPETTRRRNHQSS